MKVYCNKFLLEFRKCICAGCKFSLLANLRANHYQKCGHHVVCSIRVFKMDFPVIKLSIVAYPQSIDCPSLVSITEAIA